MKPWPKHPMIYEINTWVWLNDLSRKYGKKMDLTGVPPQEWNAIAQLKFDAVWLMGVWERSPAGIAVALSNEGLMRDFRRALPDLKKEDVVGSPYCVRRYEVAAGLGGRKGLAIARKILADRGMRLILDFVPNHVAPDHPWATEHPDYFIRGNDEDLKRDPAAFLRVDGNIYACGKDPFFPAWPDVLQLNAFSPGLRRAAYETLSDIASQSDAVRCDMAMLMMNSVFARTWGPRAGKMPGTDYWPDVINGVRKDHRDFLFIAEAYWDMEWELQQQGFDFCYDKRLYDRLEHDNAESVRLHLMADPSYQNKLVRFIENHDEPRASATFHPAKERAAAITVTTITGASLIHEGQMEGRKVRIPVFLARRPEEQIDPELLKFYEQLFKALTEKGVRRGEWRMCERTGWPDNFSHMNIVSWCWRNEPAMHLVVVNLSGQRSQARIHLPWGGLAGLSWKLNDLISGTEYDRHGDELEWKGLYVDLEPWQFNFFEVELISSVPEKATAGTRARAVHVK